MSCATAVFGEKRPFLLRRAVPSLGTRCLHQAGELRAFGCVFMEMLYGHCSGAFPHYRPHAGSQPSAYILFSASLPPPCCQSPPAHQRPFPALGDGAQLTGEEHFSESPAHASGEGEHIGQPAVPFPLHLCCTFHFWLGRGVRANFILLL